MGQVSASAPFIVGTSEPAPGDAGKEAPCRVVSNDRVNSAYRHLVIAAGPAALAAQPGQFFNLCPSRAARFPWPRRPLSVYEVDAAAARISFLHGCTGSGADRLAGLKKDDVINVAGPLGTGFRLDPAWRHVVMLGRGAGLAPLAALAQQAVTIGVGVTAIVSARTADLMMADTVFATAGTVVPVLDTDRSGDVDNVERLVEGVIGGQRVDAFFTAGSNRLMQLLKRLGRRHGIPGQVALEQVMACTFGPCYVCVRNFDVDGRRQLRRICIDGPVFDLQEAAGV